MTTRISPVLFLSLLLPTLLCTQRASAGDVVVCACNATYSVGDRVVALVNNPSDNPEVLAGDLGTVICGLDSTSLSILIQWDDISSGHDGNGYCECGNTNPDPSNQRWWVLCEEIALEGSSGPTWTVDDDGTADFDNIQEAVAAASDGDEILVYPGTYTSTGDEVVDMLGKSLVLRSSAGAETTIIDGEGVRTGILCENLTTGEALIQGFTIRNGMALQREVLGSFYFLGGGIYVQDSSMNISGCILDSNPADGGWGGGVFVFCTKYGNTLQTQLSLCTFTSNTCSYDGAGFFGYQANIDFEGCTFDSNVALEGGGGIFLQLSDAVIQGCTITNNSALTLQGTSGGGVNIYKSTLMMSDSLVCGNTPDQLSGTWTDAGGNTVSDSCSGKQTGACCVGSSCSIQDESNCTASGGTYLGDGTTCASDPCGGSGTIWTVDDDGTADFDNIQEAVAAASDGDEILVYPGTYTDTADNVVDMMGKAVWLHSSDGPEVTIIDGEDARRGIACETNETPGTVIEGFTVTRGSTINLPEGVDGGGMCCHYSSPTVTNCIFTNNTTVRQYENGAGMYNLSSSPTITNCVFDDNHSYQAGGGLFNYSSNTTLIDCTISNNSCANAFGGGGGIYNSLYCSTTITNCTITNNISNKFGGGVYNSEGEWKTTLTDTTVCGNSPDQVHGPWTDAGGNTVSDSCSGKQTGACCVGSSCSIQDESNCTASGGTYLGDGTTCASNPCGGSGTTWTVDDDGTADFATIQAAVDAASNGDEILVYPGTYTAEGDNVVDTLGKAIWLHSSEGAEATIIDGGGVRRGIMCRSGETNDTVIEGFTIQNCDAPWFDWDGSGSETGWEHSGGGMGMLGSSPTVADCIFFNNRGMYGGGMYNRNSSYPIIDSCMFHYNTAYDYAGGAIRNVITSNAIITNCTFEHNTAASYGGAIGTSASDSDAAVEGSSFCGNIPDHVNYTWTDNGGNSFSNSCKGDVTGACCLGFNCSVETEAYCDAVGGIYFGDETACEVGSCESGTTWTVDDDGSADFDSIQAAVDAASDGDEIVIQPGFYTGTGDQVIDLLGKFLWLRSSEGPEVTIIDGEGVRRGILMENVLGSRIEGLTIRHCLATPVPWGSDSLNLGGGMYITFSIATVENCILDYNDAPGDDGWGGGVFSNESSDLDFIDCTFTNNNAGRDGGGIFHFNSVFNHVDCIIERNCVVESGGGVFIQGGSGYISDCTIKANSTAPMVGGNSGGGIVILTGLLQLSNSQVCGNSPEQIDGDYNDGGGNTILDTCPDEGTTWTVDDDGPADFDNIQDAINAAASGDEILVAEGTYTTTNADLPIMDSLGKFLTIKGTPGTDGMPLTILDGELQRRIFLCTEGSVIVLSNFMFINGTTTGDIFPDNAGGAIHVDVLSQLLLEDCVFLGNQATGYGGAIFSQGEMSLQRCVLDGNAAETNGGAIQNQSTAILYMYECTVTNNTACYVGGVYSWSESASNCLVEDSTFCGNQPGQLGGDWTDLGGTCLSHHCLDSDGDGMPDCEAYGLDPDPMVPSEYATITEAVDAAADGAIVSIAPGTHATDMTIDFMGKAITLQGTASIIGEPMTILDGQLEHRILQCTSGEEATSRIENLVVTNGSTICWGGGLLNLGGSPSADNCVFTGNYALFSGGAIANYAASNMTITNCLITGNESLSFGGGLYNYESTPSLANTTVCDNLYDQISGDWADKGGNCVVNSCDDCDEVVEVTVPGDYGTISEAIEASSDGWRIMVSPGTYFEQIDFMGRAITIESTDGPDMTIIDGTSINEGSIATFVTGEGPESVLRGFTIANGTKGTSAIHDSEDVNLHGGGIYIHLASPTIENCIFMNCGADTGGAVFIHESSALFTGCSFLENSAAISGGGMSLQFFQGTVENCFFTSNTAIVTGGAIDLWSGSPTISACTFEGNSCIASGGAIALSWSSSETGNALVDGCVVQHNTTQVNGGGLWLRDDDPTITPGWVRLSNSLICNNVPDNVNASAPVPWDDLGGNELCGCTGDVNFDGQVNGADMTIILASWGVCPDPLECIADINGDGIVDGADVTQVFGNWGMCP